MFLLIFFLHTISLIYFSSSFHVRVQLPNIVLQLATEKKIWNKSRTKYKCMWFVICEFCFVVIHFSCIRPSRPLLACQTAYFFFHVCRKKKSQTHWINGFVSLRDARISIWKVFYFFFFSYVCCLYNNTRRLGFTVFCCSFGTRNHFHTYWHIGHTHTHTQIQCRLLLYYLMYESWCRVLLFRLGQNTFYNLFFSALSKYQLCACCFLFVFFFIGDFRL